MVAQHSFVISFETHMPGSVDLVALARSALVESGALKPESLVKDASETVRSVLSSSIRQRAKSSPRCFVAVPFQVLEKTVDASGKETETLLREAIDPGLLENDKWVIVDYKTDSPPPDQLALVVELYRGQVNKYAEMWKKMAGAGVAEVTLNFTRFHKCLS